MDSPFGGDPITVTKFEAARRQLDTAIHMWFRDEDAVSTLALAFASHEVIHKLYRKAGHSDLIFDSQLIRDEYRTEFALMLKEAPSFFKHSNRSDGDESVTFRPGYAPMMLMMSCYALVKIGHTLNNVENAALIWFALHFPTPEFLASVSNKGLPVDVIEHARSRNKAEFFEAIASAGGLWGKEIIGR